MTSKRYKYYGFTLIELMMTILIVAIAILAISGVIAGAHKDYAAMFKRVHGQITTDAYTSRLRFEFYCRKSVGRISARSRR